MKCVNATSLFQQLNNTFGDVDKVVLAGADATTQSYLAKYLTVYSTGIYEQSIEEIIWEYAALLGSPEIENFVSNQLDKNFRNPDMSNILNLVKQFSTLWYNSLKALDSRYKNAIDSIVNNKNDIAHGRLSFVTVSDITNYHKDATVVIEKIDELFLGI